MPWSGGVYTRSNGVFTGATVWASDASVGTDITTAHHDTHDQDLATGLNNCVTIDGLNQIAASFIPKADATYNLGSGSFRWANVYVSGNVTGGTFVNSTINAPALTGAVTGTYTLGGTPTITAPTITTPTITAPTITGVITATGSITGLTIPLTAIQGGTGLGVFPFYDYLGGLTLSIDGTNPNVVLDIAAGVAADSTNAVFINLGAFKKSTSGLWTAGSGLTGMGTGLTVADNTWYHVFAIINAGAEDAYFDTSVTAANAPAGTTAYRRIGSVLTNGSAFILPFVQVGDEFLWTTMTADANGTSVTSTAGTLPLSVPTGVQVRARMRAQYVSSGGSASALLVSSFDESSQSAGGTDTLYSNSSSDTVAAEIITRTNTSGAVRVRSGSTSGTLSVGTYGWFDDRGKYA